MSRDQNSGHPAFRTEFDVRPILVHIVILADISRKSGVSTPKFQFWTYADFRPFLRFSISDN